MRPAAGDRTAPWGRDRRHGLAVGEASQPFDMSTGLVPLWRQWARRASPSSTRKLPMTRSRISTLSVLSALWAGCAGSLDQPATVAVHPDQAPAPGVAAATTTPLAADFDGAPAIPLDQWRRVRDEGKTAARAKDPVQRIAECKTFIEKHGDHHEAGAVLTALADAMAGSGDFQADELASFVEKRCATEEDAITLPMDLVREYHVKHGLPLASAIRLLEESRSRITAEWTDKVDNESDEESRKRSADLLSYRRIQTYVLEGRVYLQHEQASKALAALDKARSETKSFQSDIQLIDAQGNITQTLGSGLLDNLHVLEATALLRLDRRDEAKKAFSRALGFVNDVEMRTMYAETRKQLGLRTNEERKITAEASMAQDFALEDTSGKTVKLSDYRGKVVLITFWATWCGPCKKEMPELQKFLAAHKDDGVEVLAINTDQFSARSSVVPFLEKSDLNLRVLYEDPKQLTDYNYGSIPALYVIDREGRVAHARTGYDADLKDKLDTEIAGLITGAKDPSRDLFAIELALHGFDVVWKRAMTGNANAVAIAPAHAGRPGEVGAIGRKGLMRWSATGDEHPIKPIAGFSRSLASADLDANGTPEWVVGGWQSLKVLDSKGELYWDYETSRVADVAKVVDLDGDGFQEIIVQDQDRVLAMKAVPTPRWQTQPIEGIESVTVLPNGNVAVQAQGSTTVYGDDGAVRSHSEKSPEGRIRRASVESSDGTLGLFGGRFDSAPNTDHDIDGDGRNDIVISGHSGLVAYSADGKPILRLHGKDTRLWTAIGDLDGKPGAEVAVFVEHYGMVVLGQRN